MIIFIQIFGRSCFIFKKPFSSETISENDLPFYPMQNLKHQPQFNL